VSNLRLDTIIVGQRCREQDGDIKALAASMDKLGLLHPIVVTPDHRLICGGRRLAAARALGWVTIPVTLAETLTDVEQAEAEAQENTHRKPYLPMELVRAARRVDEALGVRARARERQGTSGKLPEVEKGRARDELAAAVGTSGRTLQTAMTVATAIESATGERAAKLQPAQKALYKPRGTSLAHKILTQVNAEDKAAASAAARPFADDEPVQLGDFRKLGTAIADASIDLIFTDPPYNAAAVPLYGAVAELAARVLVPGGICVCYAGHLYLPRLYAGMAQHLDFLWTFAIKHSGGELRFRKYHIRNAFKPLLAFYKPPLNLWWSWFSDLTTGGREKDEHEWQQAEAEAAHFIEALCPQGGIVLDPMCGSGTTLVAARKLGRRFLGYDNDLNALTSARERLEQAK